tara:strand:- start:10717 stop:10833 length:117 start_codon:yes stop_codon:yes gene_type:complete
MLKQKNFADISKGNLHVVNFTYEINKILEVIKLSAKKG